MFRSFGSHTDQCSYGGSTAHQAPELVPSLARLFSRPPSSVLAKMANLDGSRSYGARWDALAGARCAMIRRFSRVYRVLLQAARVEGFGSGRLPDFLGLEDGGELALLGQEELGICVLEAALREQLSSLLRFAVRGKQRLVSGPAGDWPHPAG